MKISRFDRQRAILALLARIRQAAPLARPALRAELAALVASYQVIDGASEAPQHRKRPRKGTRCEMYELNDLGSAAHEAGHAIAAASLGIGSTLEIREDGGQCRYERFPASPEDRIMLSLAGEVAEALLFNGGDLRRAVTDCLASGASEYSDNRGLCEALREVPTYLHRDVVFEQAHRARGVLQENRAEFDALRREVLENGRAAYNPPRGSRGMAPPELRAAADDAERAGHVVKARLMRAAADGRVLPGVERRVLADPRHPLIEGPVHQYKES